ncbi:ankyrin repeat-containing domain protein, partial [Schizophyllum commune]
MLVNKGANIYLAPILGTDSATTLLHEAIVRNTDIEDFEFLLSIGETPDARDQHGCTPLHVAIRRLSRNASVSLQHIEALLDAGADANVPESGGCAPLHLAIQLLDRCCTGDLCQTVAALTRRLISAGAKINGRDRQGRTALHIVAQYGDRHGTIAGFLISEGKDIDAQDNSGQTALHIA